MEATPTQEAAEIPAKKRGRPAKPKEAVEVPNRLGDDLVVRQIPLDKIDLEDTAYRFRAVVRVPELMKSIQESGQQIPAVVRPRPNGGFQLISGFRRATALKQLGAKTIAAYVRKDLDNDEEAFRASVLENMARRTYSDIDRAYVIKRFQEEGYQSFEVADLMHLTKRQKNNLLSLLDLPQAVQVAIGEEGTTFKATHALTLKKLKGKYKDLNYTQWVTRINNENLSVSEITRRVNESYREKAQKKGMPSIFRKDGTNIEKGDVRLRPVKFNVNSLDAAEKDQLKKDLMAVVALL